jgi:diacylglycerol kinase family enzyme
VGFIPLFAKKLPEATTLRVYAVGGDGILFDCLNGIMRLGNASSTELAAVPYGHTNNFLQGFEKGDRALFRRVSQQFNAPAMPMDVMRCGSNYALNYCVVGFEAEAIRSTEKIRAQMEKGHSLNQWLCRQSYSLFYMMGIFSASGNKKLLHQKYEVNVEGEQFSGAYQGFSILNGTHYCGNMHPIKSAMPNDGILDMLSTRSMGTFKTFFLFPFYKSGYYKISPRNFMLKKGKKIHIRSEATLQICMDDIVFFEPDLEVELLPSAIKFVDAGKHGYKGGQS